MEKENKKVPEVEIDPQMIAWANETHEVLMTQSLNEAKASWYLIWEIPNDKLTAEDKENIRALGISIYIQKTKALGNYQKEETKEEQPATDKQIALMKQLKITIPENCSKHTASELIDKKFNRRR